MRSITLRRRPGTSPGGWRGRAPLALLVAGCVAVVTVAVSGAGEGTPGLGFLQSGHWVYNSALGTAFHIDGGTKQVDGQVEVDGADPGSPVVQTDGSGYVLSNGHTIEFGKSDLTVRPPVDAGSDEQPLGLESGGIAYAVRVSAGMVQRFGRQPLVLNLGGPIGRPVTTADGTLWLHRADTGQLCQLPPEADRVSCPAGVGANARGALAIVGDRAVYVDLAAGTVRSVQSDGSGAPVSLGTLDLGPDAVVASHDVGGRLAILDRGRQRLHLVDTASLDAERPATPPQTRQLPRGDRYTDVATAGRAVALVDEKSGALVTYDPAGTERKERLRAPKDRAGKTAKARLVRGEDSRLYVDSETGDHVMVVDEDGELDRVDTSAEAKSKDRKPKPPPAEPTGRQREPIKQPTRPDRRPDDPAEGRTGRPDEPESKPDDPGESERDRDDEREERAREPQVVARVPGPPQQVEATAGRGSAEVSWGPAAHHGARVRSYLITWSGGGRRTVDGSARRATITGLADGASYVFTVRATNRVGTGPGRSSAAVRLVPQDPPDAPGRVTASGGDRSATVDWTAAAGNGSAITGYRITWSGGSRTTSAGTRQATITGLTNGRRYVFTVRARSAVGLGAGRSAAPVTPADPVRAAEAPPQLRAVPTSETIDLEWQRPGLNGGTLVHYVVNTSGVLDRTTTATSMNFPNLENGQRYTFTVWAVTRTPDGRTLKGAPAQVVGTPRESGTVPSVDVTDARQTGHREVTLTVWIDGGGDWENTCHIRWEDSSTVRNLRCNASQDDGQGVSRELVLSNLPRAGEYTFWATATNSVGTGSRGESATVTVTD